MAYDQILNLNQNLAQIKNGLVSFVVEYIINHTMFIDSNQLEEVMNSDKINLQRLECNNFWKI